MKPLTTDLATAVTRLERQVRRMRFALTAVVLAAGAVALSAWRAPQGQSVTAERFFVLDADGVPRGSFGLLADGASVGMMFTDVSGNVRAEVRVDPAGTPRIAIFDDQQRVRSEMSIGDDGTPRFLLAGTDEGPRGAFTVADNGATQLLFLDNDGNRRALMGVVEDGRPFVILSDAAGEPIFQAPQAAPTGPNQ